jgi:predicted nucleic-acid-binding Zn-ribbon protein
MALSAEHTKKLEAWMKAHNAANPCPMCGSKHWGTGEIISAAVMQGKNTVLGGPSIPMVQVICDNCSYVALFAAVRVFGPNL